MYDLNKFRKLMKEYITFYHEYNIPENDFFKSSDNNSGEKILIVSSPSRMGNHLLMSLLDNHPEIPRVSGEDGFLTFSFIEANYNLNSFIKQSKNIDYLFNLNMNNTDNKWRLAKEYFDNNTISEQCSGVGIKDIPSVLDFQGKLIDINYNRYREFFYNHFPENVENYKTLFLHNINALNLLDQEFDLLKENYKFDGHINYSGMRRQVLWVLKNFKNAKIITSIRPFETYAISHIKSRHGVNEKITQEHVTEAWEHWYHKVVDYFYLKYNYPNNIEIVDYQDIIENTELVMKSISKFLDINYHKNLLEPTLYGSKVKGNSHKKNSEKNEGKIYSNSEKLNEKFIPNDYYKLKEIFSYIKSY